MRAIMIVLSACLISAGSFAADQTSAGANSKLAAMLAAKDANGKPIISPEEQAYFNGLNDNLRALLNDLVQKEVITRPEHLATLLGLQLRPQKMEVLLQNRCVLCHTDSESQSAENLFSVSTGSRQPATHMHLKEVVEDVHFRLGVSCAGCHGGDPAVHRRTWPDQDGSHGSLFPRLQGAEQAVAVAGPGHGNGQRRSLGAAPQQGLQVLVAVQDDVGPGPSRQRDVLGRQSDRHAALGECGRAGIQAGGR